MHDRATIHSLDGLRAASVLLVATSHCGFGDVVPGGMGVTVFFFLSGYLITRLLGEEYLLSRKISLKTFYIKRFFRLSPPLFALLALSSLLVETGALGGRITFAGLAAQASYLSNYYSLFWDTGNTTAAGTGILWSLSVEEHFYCVYPLALLYLLNRCARKTIFSVLAAVCLGVLAWRMVLAGSPGFHDSRTYYSTDTRIDSILFGCLLAIGFDPLRQTISQPSRRAASRRLLLGTGLVLLMLTVVVRSPYFRETFRYSLQGIALLPVFYAILSSDRGPLHRLLNLPAVVWLGQRSYAFYLFHFVIIDLLIRHTALGSSRAMLLAAVLTLACGLSAALHGLVERPALRLRGRVLAWSGCRVSGRAIPAQ